MLWGILFLVCAASFAAVMIFEKRTVCSGFLLLLSLVLSGVFLISLAGTSPEYFTEHPVLHLLLDAELVLIIVLLGIPLLMIPVFLTGGIVLMKKEGFRFRNLLSLGLSAALFALDIFYPLLFDIKKRGPATWIYWYLTLILLYFAVQLSSFLLSNLLNLIHFKKNRGLSYVVVLGAGLIKGKPTPLLRARIEKGIRVYRDNPGSKLIFSGGQGSDEEVSEGFAMAEYALSQGVPEKDILREERSSNTEENIRFSAAVMAEKEGKSGAFFGVVTSSYHVLRALLIARRQKLSCIGYGAKTRLYFSMNAILREYAGYFRDTRKKRLIRLAGLTVVYLAFLFSVL